MLQCEIEINLALWGRQRWVEKSLILHKTGRKEATVSGTSVLAWHFKWYCERSTEYFNVNSDILLSSPSSCGVHIYLLAWGKEMCRRNQSCDQQDQSASATDRKEAINNHTHHYTKDPWTHSNVHICWLLTFPSGGWTSKKNVLLI